MIDDNAGEHGSPAPHAENVEMSFSEKTHQMLNLPGLRRIHRENRTRETNKAVNIEARIPIVIVTAKPFTGPVPNWNRNTAAINVVILASRIAERALPKPASIADRTVLPSASSARAAASPPGESSSNL